MAGRSSFPLATIACATATTYWVHREEFPKIGTQFEVLLNVSSKGRKHKLDKLFKILFDICGTFNF